jgi:hypothetical protein
MVTITQQNESLLEIFTKLSKVIPIKHDVVISYSGNHFLKFTWFFRINRHPYTISKTIAMEQLHSYNAIDFIEETCHAAFVEFQELKNNI